MLGDDLGVEHGQPGDGEMFGDRVQRQLGSCLGGRRRGVAVVVGRDLVDQGPPLLDAARLLPTPRASDTGTAGRKAGAGCWPPLSQQVLPLVDPEAFLPTPRATDGTKGCPAQRGSKGDLMLPSAVIRLLTPPIHTQADRNEPDAIS